MSFDLSRVESLVDIDFESWPQGPKIPSLVLVPPSKFSLKYLVQNIVLNRYII